MYKLRPIVASIALTCCIFQPVYGQESHSMTARDKLIALDRSISQMNSTDSKTAHDYAAAVLANTVFKTAGSDTIERCARAEHEYRNNLRGPISEAQIARAVDLLGKSLSIANFPQTNTAQVRAFRFQLVTIVPHLVESPSRPADALFTDVLPPSSALYVASLLFEQKVKNPSYQMSPDDWVKSLSMHGLHDSYLPTQTRVVASTIDSQRFNALSNFKQGLAVNDSRAAKALDQFLTELTLAK